MDSLLLSRHLGHDMDRKKQDKPEKKALCLDLSYQSLENLLPTAIAEPRYLQFLYLHGNLLDTLRDDFFDNLPSLRHLDLRHNCLVEIPVSIAGHNSLEVLLLQDNQLPALPCELGQVPRLRKLQFSGNPLSWPPEEVMSQGLEKILSFLRSDFMDKLSKGEADAIPKADIYDCTSDTKGTMDCFSYKALRKAVSLDESQPSTSSGQRSSVSSFSFISSSKQRNPQWLCQKQFKRGNSARLLYAKGGSKQLKHHVFSEHTARPKDLKRPSLLPYVSPEHAQAIMNGQSYPLGYKKRSSPSTSKIYKTVFQKLWINQLKYVLQSQDDALQKLKTFEALKQWRQKAKSVDRSTSHHNYTGLNLPYDFDANCLKMVTRAGLQLFQNESLEKRGHLKPNTMSCVKVIGLQQKINQILQSFEELKVSNPKNNCTLTDSDPSTRRKLLSEEMKKICDLQKAVQALRLSV